MSEADHPDLLEVHSALSALTFAVKQSLDPILAEVRIEWREFTYLRVCIEVREKNKQRVVDILKHGALSGPYDYRFSVSYPTMIDDPDQWIVVEAYPDMCRDRDLRKSA